MEFLKRFAIGFLCIPAILIVVICVVLLCFLPIIIGGSIHGELMGPIWGFVNIIWVLTIIGMMFAFSGEGAKMTKFELHRDNFDYTIKHGAVIVGTFREILEIDAVLRAKAFISSWNATLEYCFESDYLELY